MSTEMPVLTTARLEIRPFEMDDLDDVHRLLDEEIENTLPGEPGLSLAERKSWLEWTVLSYHHLASLYQPPYGDRAIVVKQGGELIGSCGYVPSLAPFDQYPHFSSSGNRLIPARYSPEVGLYYAVSPRFRNRGIASEAARALVAYGFEQLNLKRIVATTTRDNLASQGVMRKLGMRVEENPLAIPPWSQIVGVLENQP